MAGGAGDVDVGEKMHFYFINAVALTSLATATFDVKREASRFVAANFGLGLGGEEVADGGKDAGVGCRIRTRGATDRRLVDDDDFVEIVDAFDTVVKTGDGLGMIKLGLEFFSEDFVDEGGFAGAGNARNDGHDAKRKLDGEIFEVVFAGADDG